MLRIDLANVVIYVKIEKAGGGVLTVIDSP